MAAILSGLTDQPNQNFPISLPDGSTATLSLQYWPQQIGWYYDLSWNGQTPPWQLLGQELVTSPNILRQFKNIIPFGITVSTIDGLDPTDQEDFVNGTATLVLLNAIDIEAIETAIYPGL